MLEEKTKFPHLWHSSQMKERKKEEEEKYDRCKKML
jgi:hypothetical protein